MALTPAPLWLSPGTSAGLASEGAVARSERSKKLRNRQAGEGSEEAPAGPGKEVGEWVEAARYAPRRALPSAGPS